MMAGRSRLRTGKSCEPGLCAESFRRQRRRDRIFRSRSRGSSARFFRYSASFVTARDFLFGNDQDGKCSGNHARPGTRVIGRGLRGRTEIRDGQVHSACFVVQSHGARPRQGLYGLHQRILIRAIFVKNRERPVSPARGDIDQSAHPRPLRSAEYRRPSRSTHRPSLKL
jgi:hypothetical protein